MNPTLHFLFIIVVLSWAFAIISSVILRTLSNHITRIGTYHKNETIGKRLSLLWKYYLFLSIPSGIIAFILLQINFHAQLDPLEMVGISLGMSSLIPLFGRISSLAGWSLPLDVIDARKKRDITAKKMAWKRENERVLSFIYALLGGTVILTGGLLINWFFQDKEISFLFFGSVQSMATLSTMVIFIPLFTALIGEGLLALVTVPDSLKC